MQAYASFVAPYRKLCVVRGQNCKYSQYSENEPLNASTQQTETSFASAPNNQPRRRSQLSEDSRKPLSLLNISNFSLLQARPIYTNDVGPKKLKNKPINPVFQKPKMREYSPVPLTSSNSRHSILNSTPGSKKDLTNSKAWSPYENKIRVKRYKASTPTPTLTYSKENTYCIDDKTLSTNITQPNEMKSTIQRAMTQVDIENTRMAPFRPSQRAIPLKTEYNLPIKKKKAKRGSLLLNTSIEFRNSRKFQENTANISSNSSSFITAGPALIYAAETGNKTKKRPMSSVPGSLNSSLLGSQRRNNRSKPDVLGGAELSSKSRPLSALSIRPNSAKQSFRQTNGFYNYDSEGRDGLSCSGSKKVLDYSFESINPPAEEELSFLKTVKDFHNEKLYNAKKSQQYLKESTALRKEIYSMIDLETNVLKSKLSERNQRDKSMLLPGTLEKQ